MAPASVESEDVLRLRTWNCRGAGAAGGWVGLGASVGAGAGSQIIGVLSGVIGVRVLGGGGGSQIMGVRVGEGVSRGDVVGGGAGSHTIGGEQVHTRVPPKTIIANNVFIKLIKSAFGAPLGLRAARMKENWLFDSSSMAHY